MTQTEIVQIITSWLRHSRALWYGIVIILCGSVKQYDHMVAMNTGPDMHGVAHVQSFLAGRQYNTG